MHTYRVALLGSPVLVGPQGIWDCPSVHVQGLLWYLAANPGRVFSRAHLAALLWAGQPEETAAHSLGIALRRLQAELPAGTVTERGGEVGLDTASEVWIDAVAFEELALRGGAHALDLALKLRQGPFLDGFSIPESPAYQDWLAQERARWDRRCLELLGALALGCERAGDWQRLADRALKALTIAPGDELYHRYVMKAWAHLGRPQEALAHFDRLPESLGRGPSSWTVALRNAIAASQARPAVNKVEAPPAVGSDEAFQVGLQWLRVGASRKSVLLVQGEAGTGKSHLVTALESALHHGEGWPGPTTILRGVCYQIASGCPPYGPVLEALRPLLAEVDLNTLPLTAGCLSEVRRALEPELRQVLPPVGEADADQAGEHLTESLARLLGVLPGRAILVLENLQWADPETVRLVEVLGRRRGDGGVAVLATARPSEVGEATKALLDQLESKGRLQRLEVGPLSRGAVDGLVESLTGNPQPALAEHVWREMKGHPHLTLEWLRGYAETRGEEEFSSSRQLPTVLRLRALIRSRVRRLEEGARSLLVAASLFPSGVSVPLLCHTAAMAEQEAADRLRVLGDRHFLQESAEGQVTFRNDLTRRIIYTELSLAERRTLHERAFEAQQGAGVQADMDWAYLADHALGAHLWTRAADLFEQLAAISSHLYAYPAAIQYLRIAVDCVDRQQEPDTDWFRRERLQQRLAEVSRDGKIGREADWIGPVVLETEEMVDPDHPLRAGLLEVAVAALRGQFRRTLGIIEWLMPLLRLTRHRTLMGSGLLLSGLSHLFRGQLEETVSVLSESMEQLSGLVSQQSIFLLTTVVGVEAALGRFGEAEQRIAAMAGSEHTAVPETMRQSSALAMLAMVANERGQWQRGLDLARESLRLARTGEHRFQEYLAHLNLGLAMARLGDVEGGLEAQRRTLVIARRMETEYAVDIAYTSLAEIYLAAGLPVRAEEAARTAIKLARDGGHRYGVAAATYSLGTAVAATGDTQVACEYIEQALSEFTAMRARPAAARCHAALGRLARKESTRRHHGRLAQVEFQALGME